MTATAAPSTRRSSPSGEWDRDGSPLAFVLRGAVLVVIGAFIGGLIGAALAGAAVAATWRRPVGLVAASAGAMLVAAAFATVFEVTPTTDSLRSNFATVRPIASTFGLAAGVLAIVAVVTAAWRERSLEPAPVVAVPAGAGRPGLVERARPLAPYAVVLLVALVIGGVAAPSPLPHAMHQLVGNLRDGDGYVVGTSGAYRASGASSPIPALLGAFGPGGATLALLLAALGSVAIAMRLAAGLAGRAARAAGLLAGVAVLVLGVVTRQQLPATVATLALLLAAYLGSEEVRPTPRAAVAGVALGIAVLSVPWTIMAAPLLVAWMGFGRDERHRGSPDAAALALIAAIVTCAPWQRYLVDRFGTWAPSTDMGFGLSSLTPFLAVALVAVAVVVTRRRVASPPAGSAAST